MTEQAETQSQVDRIGTKIRITLPNGVKYKFNDYMSAINFINKMKLKVDPLIGMPDFFSEKISPELRNE